MIDSEIYVLSDIRHQADRENVQQVVNSLNSALGDGVAFHLIAENQECLANGGDMREDMKEIVLSSIDKCSTMVLIPTMNEENTADFYIWATYLAGYAFRAGKKFIICELENCHLEGYDLLRETALDVVQCPYVPDEYSILYSS